MAKVPDTPHVILQIVHVHKLGERPHMHDSGSSQVFRSPSGSRGNIASSSWGLSYSRSCRVSYCAELLDGVSSSAVHLLQYGRGGRPLFLRLLLSLFRYRPPLPVLLDSIFIVWEGSLRELSISYQSLRQERLSKEHISRGGLQKQIEFQKMFN